jgi:hypothetical protein
MDEYAVAQVEPVRLPGVGQLDADRELLVPGLGSVDADGDRVEDRTWGQRGEVVAYLRSLPALWAVRKFMRAVLRAQRHETSTAPATRSVAPSSCGTPSSG